MAYEVTGRMAADIDTKAFSNSRKWKHACMQIGLLEPEMLADPETLKMVTSSFDPKKGTVQAATGSIDGILTKLPIMPPDQEGLHEHEGHDPVIVAKVPKLTRYQPPLTVQCPIGTRWLRSTWFLCTRYSLRPQLPRLFSRDNILDGTSLSNCSFRKSMARTS